MVQMVGRNQSQEKLAWTNIIVVPNVRIPEWEERRPPRQCNWQKGEVYY